MVRFGGLAACVLLFGAIATVVHADNPPPMSPSIAAQTHAPLPTDVDALDVALKSEDYEAINHAHAALKSGDDLVLFMNWEQERSFEGGGFYVTYIYMVDLWNLGSNISSTTPEQAAEVAQLKQTAVFVGAFAYALLVLDGTKCADQTAVGHRLDQLMGNNVETWAYVDQMSPELRARIVTHVLQLESFSAAKRRNDTLLCSGGMTEMAASLAAQAESGKAPQEVPNAPGVIGKTYAVPPAPVTKLFIDDAVWQPQQAKLREAMPARLAALMKLSTPSTK